MGLREIRKERNLTQKELAQRSGVNFRSLQDYEQGHKKLTSANGDILRRLSTVLGCTTEDLLLDAFHYKTVVPESHQHPDSWLLTTTHHLNHPTTSLLLYIPRQLKGAAEYPHWQMSISYVPVHNLAVNEN